jgi:hypothetical protein
LFGLIAVGLLGIIRDPLIMGPDEGMELSKSLLISRAGADVTGVWNDQPWLYSQIYAHVFHNEIAAARIATFCCYVAFCGLMVFLCIDEVHPLALAVFPWLLWGWNELLDLTLSSMCEVPAICLAAVGMLLLCRPGNSWARILISGGLVGFAAGIKLTGGLMAVALPAVLIRREIGPPGSRAGGWRSRCLAGGLLWLGAAAAAILAGIWISPDFKPENVWGVHFRISSENLADIRRHHIGFHDLLSAPGCLLLAVFGAFQGLRSSSGPVRTVATWAAITACTSLAINAGHYPFWFFYRLHYALPLCVLAVFGADSIVRSAVSACRRRGGYGEQPAVLHLGCAAIALFIAFDGRQLLTQSQNLFSKPATDSDPIVQRLVRYSGRARFAYSNDNMRIARAGLQMLPSLTITSLKRFWSGDLNEASLVAAIETNNVDVLLLQLRLDGEGKGWESLLTNSYVRVFSTDEKVLYLNSRLDPVPEHQTITQLKARGIIK